MCPLWLGLEWIAKPFTGPYHVSPCCQTDLLYSDFVTAQVTSTRLSHQRCKSLCCFTYLRHTIMCNHSFLEKMLNLQHVFINSNSWRYPCQHNPTSFFMGQNNPSWNIYVTQAVPDMLLLSLALHCAIFKCFISCCSSPIVHVLPPCHLTSLPGTHPDILACT